MLPWELGHLAEPISELWNGRGPTEWRDRCILLEQWRGGVARGAPEIEPPLLAS